MARRVIYFATVDVARSLRRQVTATPDLEPDPSSASRCDAAPPPAGNGKDIAYDKKSRDTCGHYLPIFGPETVPSQSACYHDYVTNPDHPGLVNKFPEPSPFTCEPDE